MNEIGSARAAANEQLLILMNELTKENYYRVFNYAKKLRNQQRIDSGRAYDVPMSEDPQYNYLSILSPAAKELVFQVIKEDNLNLYHSAAAYISNRIQLESDEIFESYYKKYSPKRKYVLENKELIREIITKVHIKVKNKNF